MPSSLPSLDRPRHRRRPPEQPAPPSGPTPDDVLDALRGGTRPRLPVDPGLAGGLADWLEDGLAPLVSERPLEAPPLVVTKALLTGRDPADLVLGPSPGLARGALVDALFRQYVTTGQIGDPMTDALSALATDEGQRTVLDYVGRLAPAPRRELDEEVRAHALGISSWWPDLSPAWLARTADRISLPLAGGRIVLAGVFDLVIGRPSTGRASVCVVELKSGERRSTDRDELSFYALLETLRSGAPPFRVAAWYSRTGAVDAFDVTDDGLAITVARIVERAGALVGPVGRLAPC